MFLRWPVERRSKRGGGYDGEDEVSEHDARFSWEHGLRAHPRLIYIYHGEWNVHFVSTACLLGSSDFPYLPLE